MEPWTFTSDDGRFEMGFRPVLDRASCTDVGLIKSDQHQVFGLFTGKAVLDDGKVIEIKTSPALPRRSRINGNNNRDCDAVPVILSPAQGRQTPARRKTPQASYPARRISFLSSTVLDCSFCRMDILDARRRQRAVASLLMLMFLCSHRRSILVLTASIVRILAS